MRLLLGAVAALLLGGLPVGAQPAEAEAPHSDGLLRLGRQIYREGVLSSGEPLRAVVQGDVPLVGGPVACVSCHRRAGMGAIESNRVVAAISGGDLFRPRESGYKPRPAYTDESLARVLREGIDPADRPTDPLMPVYELPDEDLRALTAYLRTLSVDYSPGVTDDEIRFATVVAGEVEPELTRAMLDVLEVFFDEKNRRTRNEVRRLESGPFYRDYKNKAYRRWVLDVWQLDGPADGWVAQLESHYHSRPVFALVGGVAVGAWDPIHRFCEKLELPSLLPNTDQPALEDDAYYTLYFSEGLTLEARALVHYLRERGEAARVLQVFRSDGAGAAAARALGAAARGRQPLRVVDWPLSGAAPLSPDRLAERVLETAATVVVLWLGPEDLAGLAARTSGTALEIYLSSTLLGEPIPELPGGLRESAFLVHPFTLPRERERRFARVQGWLRSRKIDGPHARIRAQSYFACMLTGDALGRIKRHFFRDYFMDSLEHADRMAAYSASYPRLSFGPGQRYLARGAYVVPLGIDSGWQRAEWVVP